MTKNRSTRLFILALTVIAIATLASTSWAVIGANLQGPSYSWSTYPVPSHLDYVKSRGVALVRLPIAWEKLQPTINGPLDPTEMANLKSFLDALASREMLAIVDIQNGGRYNPNWAAQVANNELVAAGTGLAIGSADLPISAFQDFWTKLAGALAGHVGIAGYDIMNEPAQLGTGVWPAAAQAAVNGIRSVDMSTTIYVEGSEWASAYWWPQQNGSLNIIDPAQNLIYEAHLYFDSDGSGKYSQTYDEQGGYPNWGVDHVQPFLNWLQQNNQKGVIGEFGVPESDPRWLTVLDNFLATLKQNNVSGTYWYYAYPDPSGAYPWWPIATGPDYYMSLVPEVNGQDKAQWSVLSPYMGPGVPPSAPSGLTAAANNGSVTLSWTASPWATSYNVYRGTTAGGEGAAPTRTGITATSYTDSVTNGVTYYYQISATNNAGTSALSSEVSATPIESFPTVTISAPADGASYTAPAAVTITANAAAESDATVSSVDFYAGTALVGTATTPPYSVTWSNVAAGSYSLTALVTDSLGEMATSPPVLVTVVPAVPPAITMIAPAIGTSYTAPATIPMSATATPGSGATVSRVDFYAGTTLLGTATAFPYNVTWNNVAAGSYSMTAKVTDSLGGTATSTAVPVTVTNPAVPPPWLTQDVGPVSLPGSASYANGTFSVQGDGYDIWGTYDAFRYVYQRLVGDGEIVARVASLQNTNTNAKAGVMIRETLTSDSPDAMMLLTAANGARFGYRATTGGTTAFTALARIAAPYWVKLVRSGNTFTGYVSRNGVDWVQVGSGSVAMGNAVYVGLAVSSHDTSKLCLSTMDGVSVSGTPATSPSVTITAPASGTSYNAPATISITATATAASGASVSNVEFYAGSTLVGTATTAPYSVTWNNVAAGNYSLTAKVTDSSGGTATSNPVTISVTETTPASVTITEPASGTSYNAPATVAITATATAGSGASVSRVDFYAGSTLVGTATATPYSVTWSNVAAGNYSLTAKVTDSSGATATSNPVTISVTETTSPSVTITEPASGTSYNAPATIAITATATAGSGASVSRVDFYAGSTLVGTATATPYSVTWSNVAAGNYSLTAKVTDSSGATATSGAVLVSVVNPDLTIIKSHTGTFNQGQTAASYTISVTNSGTTATTGTVTVTDSLPAALTATEISGSGWSCTLGTLTCTRSDALAAGSSYPPITLTFNVASDAPASVTNTATVSGGGDSNTSNNTASDPTTIASAVPDLTITKTHKGNFNRRQRGTYTITVTNKGTAPTSGTVTVVDTLPSVLTATAISGSGWSCTLVTATCSRSDALAAGSSYPPITLTVNVASTTPASVTNTVAVSGGGEVNTSNDTANDPTSVK